MNKKEEREKRKMIRKRRLELAYKQNILQTGYCDPCRRGKPKELKECHGCEVFEQLKAIGDELTELSKGIAKRKEIKPMAGEAKNKASELTVEKYLELQEQGLTDTKIAEQFNIPASTFYTWKKKNGLIKPKEVKKQEPTATNDTSAPTVEQLQKEIDSLLDRIKTLQEEKNQLFEDNARIREEKKQLSEQVKQLTEENKQLSINLLRANDLYEDANEENELMKKDVARGKFYMRLSLMLMEGILAELKEDAS